MITWINRYRANFVGPNGLTYNIVFTDGVWEWRNPATGYFSPMFITYDECYTHLIHTLNKL